MIRPTERPTAPALTLKDLRRKRDYARAEYLAATHAISRDTTERGRLWRAFIVANAAYLRARGEAQ